MPKRYPPEFRRAACARLVAGEKVMALSKELGVSEPTLYSWKRQALIDAGRAEGIKSFEADELAPGPQDHRRARRGELLALRWSDIDLDRGRLSIERGIVRVGTTSSN